MAIVSTASVTPTLSGLNALNGANDPGVFLGLRGAGALGSGLRAGVTLVDGAERSAAEVQEAREAAAEAAREAAAEDTRENDRARQRIAESTGSGDLSGAEGEDELSDGTVLEAVNAAVAAGEAGEPTERGTFLDVSV